MMASVISNRSPKALKGLEQLLIFTAEGIMKKLKMPES